MGRINTNVAALQAQVGLNNSQGQLNTALQRLSTGLRINSGADDPAGLIASNSLESEIAGLNQAVSNSQTATHVISTADGALHEISSLLLNVKSLVVESANSGALSTTELQANQLQVDSAIQSITRIANTTSFAGLNLLNGSLAYRHQRRGRLKRPDRPRLTFLCRRSSDPTPPSPCKVDVLYQRLHRRSAISRPAPFKPNSVTLNVITGNQGTQTLTLHQRHPRLGHRLCRQHHQRFHRCEGRPRSRRLVPLGHHVPELRVRLGAVRLGHRPDRHVQYRRHFRQRQEPHHRSRRRRHGQRLAHRRQRA